jgi:hypothetical protein
MSSESTPAQVLVATLKREFIDAGYFSQNEGGVCVLTAAGRAYLDGYEARHPKLKLEDLGGIVREFEALGVEAWEDASRVEVWLKLRGKTVEVVRYVSRVPTPGFSKELVEDMRAELAQREAPQTT